MSKCLGGESTSSTFFGCILYSLHRTRLPSLHSSNASEVNFEFFYQIDPLLLSFVIEPIEDITCFRSLLLICAGCLLRSCNRWPSRPIPRLPRLPIRRRLHRRPYLGRKPRRRRRCRSKRYRRGGDDRRQYRGGGRSGRWAQGDDAQPCAARAGDGPGMSLRLCISHGLTPNPFKGALCA